MSSGNKFNPISNLIEEKSLLFDGDFEKYHDKMDIIPHDLKKEAIAEDS